MINTFTELFICYITGTCVLCTCQNMRCHNPIEIMRVLCVASSTNYSYTHLSIYTYMYVYMYMRSLFSGLAYTNLAARQRVLQFLKMCVVQSLAYLCRITLT